MIVYIVTTETNGTRNGEPELSIEGVYLAEQDAIDAVQGLRLISEAQGETLAPGDDDEPGPADPDDWTIDHTFTAHQVR